MQRLSHELHGALAARVPVQAVLWGGSQRALPLFAGLAALRAATWLIASAAPEDEVVLAGDVVLAPLGLALGRAFGRPVAVVAHGLDVVYAHPLHAALVLPALRRVDRVLAISESTRRLAIERGVAPARCVAVGAAVEPDATPAREAARTRIEAGLGTQIGERPLLLTVGRLVPRKGVAWFVGEVMPRVLADRPDALYLVVGSGPERQTIESAAAQLPVRGAVRVVADADDRLRSALYGGADLFVMPNRAVAGDAEGFGLVAAEAAHAGLPTVGCAVDSVPEAVVDGVTGLLVPPDSPRALADAIITLLANDEVRARLGQSARREAVERFGWSKVGDGYLEALSRLVTDTPRTGTRP